MYLKFTYNSPVSDLKVTKIKQKILAFMQNDIIYFNLYIYLKTYIRVV